MVNTAEADIVCPTVTTEDPNRLLGEVFAVSKNILLSITVTVKALKCFNECLRSCSILCAVINSFKICICSSKYVFRCPVVNRLARALGHLEKVKRMVEEGYDCSEVLVQLAAVRSALDNTGKVILQDHLRHCMVDAVAAGDENAIDDLCSAIDKFMK